MAETTVTVIGTKLNRTPPTDDVTVYVDNKIVSRFENVSISKAIDLCPMTFNMSYGLKDGETGDALDFFSTDVDEDSINSSGLLVKGQKVEIYLMKQKVLTGYIENAVESYSHGEHILSISGRSIVSPIVDCTTDKPSGWSPDSTSNLSDVANYMFNGRGIKVVDKTDGSVKFKFGLIGQIDLTTKPFDYVSTLCQYEGKLLYDDEYGRMVIADVASKESLEDSTHDVNGNTYVGTDSDGVQEWDMTNKKINTFNDDVVAQLFEKIEWFQTTLGRYRTYSVVVNAYGGPAGIDNSLIPVSPVNDPQPNELPPGKTLTIVSTAAYPTDGNVNGLIEFQKTLLQYMANKNWGASQTISITATGFINPITKKLWKPNECFGFSLTKPKIQGDFVVQSVNFYESRDSGKMTDLVFIRREALTPEPIVITPMIAGTNNVDIPEDSTNNGQSTTSTDKNQRLNISDTPPPNAKENSSK
ncbi:phage baseplate assembly protein [Gluconobacter frateurii]|uniref:Baseplate hub protein gp44-like N-terminal domain-containing protein n=1 Tax=Gluconobacter frateurii NRIC 0228 TaxID=1307946 RepID=A0ABQ0QDB8_9PROT|nr:hypothetical protein [Gluconobacter frateurii]GBR14145.1 hypothetical protein AA0228_2186 [Gluconobacter frateurii NRIC 0228]GLP92016.1 hypothetical protein GCM10007868_30910 [Gluconobacter frateurii]